MSNLFGMQRGHGALSLLLAIAFVAAPAVAEDTAAADVTHCDLLVGENGVRVEISADGEWTHRAFRMSDPDRYVVDVMGARRASGASTFAGDGQFVQRIRSSQYRLDPDPVTRFVIDLANAPDVSLERYDGGLAVQIGGAGTDAEARVETAAADVATDPARPSELPQVTYRPVEELVLDRPDGDHWQDQTGVARIAEPQRRDEDGSYSRTMSINMQNADIRTILRAVANFSGRNIIAAPEVQGSVTVALTDVPWREALAVILRAHAFGYVEENGILRVDTAENLRNEELAEKAAAQRSTELEKLVTRIVHIDYANAGEIKESVEKMLTPRGSIEVDDRTNSLIVNDIAASVEELASLAAELDTRTPQVHIDALMVDIDAQYSQELGVTWGVLDAAPNGIDAKGDLIVDNSIAEAAGTLRVGTVQNWAELQAQLQALARSNVANIISNPRITTTDNREANILVGQKIPLITQDVAGNAVTRLETIGIRMIVTPHINSDRQITLDVHPEVSDLSSQATVQGGVIINTSEADTRVLVNNAETAVIGGLIRNVTTRFSAGVPVLKDLPLVGALFRTESTNDAQRELIVFLTPTIVDEEGVATEHQWQIKDSVERLIERNLATGVIQE